MTIIAGYNGTCGCCGKFYPAGTEITKIDGYWWIYSHTLEPSTLGKELVPCKDCNLIHSGECF